MFNSIPRFKNSFQAIETRIHLLQQKSLDFLNDVFKNFFKPNLLKDVLNIDFDKIENQKSLDEVNLGSECEQYLHELQKDGHMDIVAVIRKNCLQFYITAAKEIRNRLPVADNFLSKLNVLQPCILFNTDIETSFNDISVIAKTIGGFDEEGLKKEWFLLQSDFDINEKYNMSTLSFDNMWKYILLSQDSTNVVKYPNLKCLLNTIRSLPNSNADSERIFSYLTDVKTKKRNKLLSSTVNAILVLKSALRTRNETALNMKIDEKHLSLMSSDKLYANSQKRQKSSLQIHAVDDDADEITYPSSSKQ